MQGDEQDESKKPTSGKCHSRAVWKQRHGHYYDSRWGSAKKVRSGSPKVVKA